jgi:hypothetical protein
MVFPVNKIGTRREIKSPVNIYHFFGKYSGKVNEEMMNLPLGITLTLSSRSDTPMRTISNLSEK